MHGSLFDASLFNHAIVQKDYVGVRYMLHTGVGRHYPKCKTLLLIFERDNISLERYCKEIIMDHVRLFRGAIGQEYMFVKNNVNPHRNAETPNTVEREDISRIQWLAYSWDLNLLSMYVMLSAEAFKK